MRRDGRLGGAKRRGSPKVVNEVPVLPKVGSLHSRGLIRTASAALVVPRQIAAQTLILDLIRTLNILIEILH